MESSHMRVNDAAQLLKVSKWTIYRWIEEGRLRDTKIGRGSLRVFRTSVDGLIDGARIDHREAQDGSRSKVTPARARTRKREK
jgi:excisionase family DNA binding protein